MYLCGAHEVPENFIGGVDGQIESQHFENEILIVNDCVAPAPEVAGLLINGEVGLFERNANTCDDEFLQFARVFFDFCRDEEGDGGDLL